jgi:CHAT domain
MSQQREYWTYRISVTNSERVQVEKLDPLRNSRGKPSRKLHFSELEAELEPMLARVRDDNAPPKDGTLLRQLGETLFNVLFDDTLRQDLLSFYYSVVEEKQQLLRIELDIDEQSLPKLAALPWEMACLPKSAQQGELQLGTNPNLVLSRTRAQWNPATPIILQPGEKLRIALAVASPKTLGKVIYTPVQEALKKLAAEQAEVVELLPILEQATPETIDELLEQKPHVFHFIGHGRFEENGQQEQIALVQPYVDEPLWVGAGYFANLFAGYHPGVVFLQACEGGALSPTQAFAGVGSRLVQQNIPVVLAMQFEVTNVTAVKFALKFYERLAKGDPVDIAAQLGRRAIALGSAQHDMRDFATPVIFMRVDNGHLFTRTPKSNGSELSVTQPNGVDITSLLNKLNRLVPTQLGTLILILQVPPNIMPGSGATHGERVNALIAWAQGLGGSGLEKVQDELEKLIRPR